MATIKKQRKALIEKYGVAPKLPLEASIEFVKESSTAKFDSSVDIAVNLNIDPKNQLQVIRENVTLPHGTGKVPRMLVLCTPDKAEEAQQAGADHIGGDEYIDKIQKGWLEFDVLISMPNFMAKLGKLGKILGPSGLMPSPKKETVTTDIGRIVKEIKAGKIAIKTEKAGIVHSSVGRVSFSPQQLKENIQEMVDTLLRAKHQSVKGANYMKKITLSTTMGMSVEVDKNTILKN